MLVLSRTPNQSVCIGDEIEIRVVQIRGDKVRLGFIAPDDVPLHRREVVLQIAEENGVSAEDAKAMTAGEIYALAGGTPAS